MKTKTVSNRKKFWNLKFQSESANASKKKIRHFLKSNFQPKSANASKQKTNIF